MADTNFNPNNLVGQKYVEWLLEDALKIIRLNHEHNTLYGDIDLGNQANVEASTTRDYYGRYLFELLQNTNDAITAAKNNPVWARTGPYRVRIEVTKSALIVANDGVPFLEKDVYSIHRWGESSKDPNKSVGHKGIGFKSVLEITNSPEVFSQVVQFRFDLDTVHRLVKEIVGKNNSLSLPIHRYVLPYSVEQLTTDRKLVDRLLNKEGFATVIRLPLRVKQETVLARIRQDIQPTLILFLEGLEELEIWVGGKVQRILRKEPNQIVGAGKDITLLENDNPISRWYLFNAPKETVDPQLIKELDDQVWAGVEKVGLAIAFPLDPNGQLLVDPRESRKLCVYFPTDLETDLPYLIHGDFYIDSARKQINADRAYNLWLIDRIAQYLAKTVVPNLVKRFPQNEQVIRILMPGAEPSGFIKKLHAAIFGKLSDTQFVPTMLGTFECPQRIMFAPPNAAVDITSFHRFFPYQELSTLCEYCQFALPAIEDDEEMIEFLVALGARRLEFSDVFKLFDGRNFVEDINQYAQLYGFLYTWYEKLDSKWDFIDKLSNSHCIVTDSSDWIKPHERLYHAKLRQETTNMPRAIQAELVHPMAYGSGGRDSSTYKLLDKLRPRVRDYDAPDIIRSSIIPLFRNNRFKKRLKVDERAEIYRYLFEYWKTRRGDGDPDTERLKAEVQVPARLITNRRSDEWRSVTEVYLSSIWSGDDRLEKLYEGFEGFAFLYEIRGLDLEPEEYAEWAEFWKWLGVNDIPKILIDEVPSYKLDYHRWNRIRSNHPHARTDLWLDYLDEVKVKHGHCRKHGADYRQLRYSVSLESFADLIETKDGPRLNLMFELLAENWPRIKRSAAKAQVHCYRSDCPQYARSDVVPSFFDYLLLQTEWIPTQTEIDGSILVELHKPNHCWFVAPSESPIIRNLIHTPLPASSDRVENQQFCRDIGMRFIDKATRSDLVDLLKHLPELYPNPEITVSAGRRRVSGALGTFSRWVIGRINNLLSAIDHVPEPLQRQFAVLAQENGKLRYVPPEESVFFADDSYYAPHWREHLPFAPMDDNWGDAARFLGFKFISKHVEESCTPGNTLDDESGRLEFRFKVARPYMLALVNSQRPSATQDVARYLLNLQIAVVDSLLVHRTLTIPPEKIIPAPEAAIYLEERRLSRVGSAGQAPRGGVLYVRKGFEENYDIMASPIADYIGIPGLSDALVVLLDRGGKDGRLRFLATRGLNAEDVDAMRQLLGDVELPDDLENSEQPKDSTLEQYLLKQLRGIDNPAPPNVPPNPPLSPTPKPKPKPSHEYEQGETSITFPEFELNQVNLTIVRTPHTIQPKSSNGNRGSGGGGGKTNWEQIQKLRDAYGKRGEELVKLLELERLRRDYGIENPEEFVTWLREEGITSADHDIESKDYIDGEWVDILIEVKATPSDEFRFPMSKEELQCAWRYQANYRLYRVINVASATPDVYVFENPYKLWNEGKAAIEPKDTYITLADPRKTDTYQETVGDEE